jgi:FkbM family methyltransferase
MESNSTLGSIQFMYHSQEGQDKFLDTHVFKGFREGVFVDVGAHDGIIINNTLFFEQERGWTGLLVEPLPAVYERLVQNRPACLHENCAVAESDGTAEFLEVSGYAEMTSGLVENYDPRHMRRIESETKDTGGTMNRIRVKTTPLARLLETHGLRHIHYLSVDVEGSEFSVLKSIDYDAVFIDVIGFENNYEDVSPPIVKFLETKGYHLLPHSSVDLFMVHTASPFFGRCN